MKLFLAGATGVLGRAIIRHAIARSHEVVGLVRSEDGAGVIRSLGASVRKADLFDSDALAVAAEGCEAVIHAATAIPVKPVTTPDDWAMNDRIRREGTRALAAAASAVGARVYLQQSIVWVARPPDDAPFDEDTPPTPEPRFQSAYDGECIARETGDANGMAVGVLRCGWFYGPEAAHTIGLAESLRNGEAPIIEPGTAQHCLLHIEDAAAAFVAAAEYAQGGLWHVVDDEPVAMADLLNEFAHLLNAPAPQSVSQAGAQAIMGAAGVDFFTRSTVTTNTRMTQETGWTPKYASYAGGLRQVVATWNAEASE